MTDDRIPLDEGQAAEVAVDAAAGTVVVRIGRLQRILSLDEALLVSVQRFRRPWRTALARTLTRLGDGKSWTVIGLACIASATQRGAHLGLRIGAATGIATLLSQALKRSLTRARPDAAITGFEALAANPDRFSFPSGHTAAAFGVAIAFADEPAGLGPAALLLAVGIGLSRVYLGAHYPLDVVAGAVLGVFGGLASRLLVS
ncbi:phosphoesterase PA-phosphatase related [Anaeromyxobacter sp. K]|uniref:Phosphoesterase PA-phosphatase related n=1 Tax=Anaeromyxobacter dehalogenans (strain ATCC BAA-258 / DSM 21875 / 2CP-1) TaxID=455488 RepID=B8J9S2_ANAD2|nr:MULTISPECIES: phosphatase PAP2 family protein [Anaeromyxobacter]ACG75320.1 phosphoesterase PA-phosphatase related [Anaeromyxobacter sp. K]ACL67460.1 phosphoesterase PA-phosphatase related [Anaeromyxobacter dehalogenans 2CP-1]